MMIRVGEQLNGRNNNFNLIRFLAASAVIYGHCFTVIQGEGHSWIIPMMKTSDFGFVAVNTFFILSGFLITKSWHDNPNLLRFTVARLLRIFPALFVTSVATALVIGSLFSTLSPADYFGDIRTWDYVLFTGTMIEDRAILPGLFATNLEQAVVNAPLWTLKYELFSYAFIGLLGGLALLANRERALVVIGSLGMVYLVIQCLTDWRDHHVVVDNIMRLWTCFLLGAVFFILRDKIVLSFKAVVLLAMLAIVLHETRLFELASTLALAYGVIWFALVPAGAILNFNRLGDYSYGLYIFAWPIQQVVVQAIPGLGPHSLFVVVFPMVLVLAVLSWHFLEKPCLALRGRLGGNINSWKDRLVMRVQFSSIQSDIRR